MTETKIIAYIIFILVEVFSMSLIEETYKKIIRKDKFKPWECRVLGLLLSIGAEALLICSNLMYPILNNLFGSSLWLDHLLYLALFYILQLKVNTLFIKKLIASFVSQWIKSHLGISLEELITKTHQS